MRVERISSGDIGLRHLLENGLSIAQGGDVEGFEKDQVLDGLLKVFSEADRGSDAFGTHNLTSALNEKRALQRFSTFYHYLRHDFGEDVPARLGEARLAISRLREDEADVEGRQRLVVVLQALLQSLYRDRALSRLRSYQKVTYR